MKTVSGALDTIPGGGATTDVVGDRSDEDRVLGVTGSEPFRQNRHLFVSRRSSRLGSTAAWVELADISVASASVGRPTESFRYRPQLVGALGFEGVGQIVSGWKGAVSGPCGRGGAVFHVLAAYAVPVVATRKGRRLGRPRREARRRRRAGRVSARRRAGCAEVLEQTDGQPFEAR
jgi:hypothetical protein